MQFIYLIVVNALALFAVSLILPTSFVFEGGALAYILAGLIITILNGVVKPILKLFAFPLVLVTAGLFLIVINALILYFTVYLIHVIDITGVALQVNGTLTYIIAALIFGLLNTLIHWFFKE